MTFQFAFAGDGVQDAGACLASFEHHAVLIGKVSDVEKLPLLVATFYSRSREWYESLPPNQQTNYQLLVHQFRSRFIRRHNAMDIREELFALRMSTTMEYFEYERVLIQRALVNMDPSTRRRRRWVVQDGPLQGGLEPLLWNGGEFKGPNKFSNSSTSVSTLQ